MYLQEVDWNHFSSSFFRCLPPINTLTFMARRAIPMIGRWEI